MSEYLYLLRPSRPAMVSEGPTERESAVVGEHFRYLKGLSERGVVVLAGRTTTDDERVMGLVVLRAGDEAGARRVMEQDPAVTAGVMKAELFPFRVAIPADRTSAAE